MSIGNWNLVVCGINHKSASVGEREPLQIGHDELAEVHAELVEYEDILEAIIVSTCNRIEFYLVTTREKKAFDLVRRFYLDFRNQDIANLSDKFYSKKNRHAVDQIFRVTSGIDSMILGENQILGQVKESYSSACAIKSAGKILHRLFHQAFRIGKQIRTDTEMGKGACSISSAAIELLRHRLSEFDKPSFLFVGVNQMISLAATGLAKLDYTDFSFSNRTISKADTMANRFHGSSFALDNLDKLLAKADVCITCTGSTAPVITRAMINAHPESFEKPLLVLDMAIPRDTDFETDAGKGVEVLNLDDIQDFVKDQQDKRREAIPEAEKIIEEKMNEFMYWYNHVRHEPLYNGLESKFEEVRQKEIAELLKTVPEYLRDDLNRATKCMTNKLLQIKMRVSSNPKDAE